MKVSIYKDKNGVNLFEGAIVKYVDDDGVPHYSPVEVIKGRFYAFHQSTKDLEELEELTESEAGECEIVGDILHNRDLLEGGEENGKAE